MPKTKRPKRLSARQKIPRVHFAIRRIANKNPRRQRNFLGLKKVSQFFLGGLLVLGGSAYFGLNFSQVAQALVTPPSPAKPEITHNCLIPEANIYTEACQEAISAYTGDAKNTKILTGGCPGGGPLVGELAGYEISPTGEIFYKEAAETSLLDEIGSAGVNTEDFNLNYQGVSQKQGFLTSDGCFVAPAFDGPGLQQGLNIFSQFYRGNTSRSALDMIVGWTNFFTGFVSVLAIAGLVYAGFLYITALGNNEQAEKAKKTAIWIVIGIILLFLAYAIINTLVVSQPGSTKDTSVEFNFGQSGFGWDN